MDPLIAEMRINRDDGYWLSSSPVLGLQGAPLGPGCGRKTSLPSGQDRRAFANMPNASLEQRSDTMVRPHFPRSNLDHHDGPLDKARQFLLSMPGAAQASPLSKGVRHDPEKSLLSSHPKADEFTNADSPCLLMLPFGPPSGTSSAA
jgi:hypothetical protein